MAMDQDIYFPDAGGTVDMTSPNALLAPDNSQNLLAPDLSGARQAVAQGPTAMPVKTGWGGFTQNGIQHSNSTKRKIGAALLSLLSPEAGAAVTDQPFNAAMGEAAQTELQRKTRLAESGTLAEHAADIAKKQADVGNIISQTNERNQKAAMEGRQHIPPTADDAVTMTLMAHPDMTPEQEAAIRKMSPAGIQDYLTKFSAIAPLFGSKPDYKKVTAALASMGKFGLSENNPEYSNGFATILEAGGKTAADKLVTALTAEPKVVPEAPVDKQMLDDFMKNPPKGYTSSPLEFNRYLNDQKIAVAKAERVDPTQILTGADANGKPAFYKVDKATNAVTQLDVKPTPKTSDVPQLVRSNVSVADRALRQTKIIRDILAQHPEMVGPLMGRASEFAQGLGSNPFAGDPKLERLGATLTGHLKYLFAQELKNAIGARPGEFLARELKEASPQRKQDINILLGALDSVDNNANVTLQSAAAQGYDPFNIGKGATGGQVAGTYKQTATGPNGHKIGSNDGQNWFDVQTGAKIQ